jgi:hypothetical protein
VKAVWGRILERYAEALLPLEDRDDWRKQSPSIYDMIQAEYREGTITEAERDAMRDHVKAYLGDPDADPVYLPDDPNMSEDDKWWRDIFGPSLDPMHDYARYACGVWAATTGPMGKTEHAYILAAVQILEQEAA